MQLWASDQLKALAGALRRARDAPSALVIEGAAGIGKSALLDELIRQSADFVLLSAVGTQQDQAPFATLRQWGVEVPRTADGGTAAAFVAAQALRSRIDDLSRTGPVLLVLDDLHWADPESVEALTWWLRRRSGDRLLVAVGTRPLGAGMHPEWQRWARVHTARLKLTGLSRDHAVTLTRSRHPAVTEAVAERLWRHTEGNPFYLTCLLEEYDPTQLEQMRMLPAPLEYAQLLAAQLGRSSDDAVRVLQTAAVLGPGWLSPFELRAVAGIGDTARATRELTAAGLLTIESREVALSVRLSHTLVQAAVYQQTPLQVRRELHTRAAAYAPAEAAALEHQLAAADQYDDRLADAMESYGWRQYQQRTFRFAAQYLHWASALTADPRRRERRWLDWLTCRLLDGDRPGVQAEAERVWQAQDAPRRSLVLGLLAVTSRRRQEGIAILSELSELPLAAVDPVLRYRIEVLLAWGRLNAGSATPLIAAGLERARQVRQDDPGFVGLELICDGLISVRLRGLAAVAAELRTLPEIAGATPLEATDQLAWRGTVRARQGRLRPAAADLEEVARRVEQGVTHLGAGMFHAFLGYVYWLAGDWGRARLTLRLAADIAGPGGVFVLTLTSLTHVGDGQFAKADQLLSQAEGAIARGPWLEAAQSLIMARIVRLHACDDRTAQTAFLPALRGTPLDPRPMDQTDPLVVMHLVQAAVWAHDVDYAQRCLARLAELAPEADWVPPMTNWLRGLVAKEQGRVQDAWTHLAAAVAATGAELPLYRAHALVDHARIAALVGEQTAAAASLSEAERRYQQLGATVYVDRLGPPGIRIELTERERDVVALLITGKSYAQIARELFITQKTVGYHLGNVYAKTGISSRHRLAELIRNQPGIFRIAPTTV